MIVMMMLIVIVIMIIMITLEFVFCNIIIIKETGAFALNP